jgi:hypothetical protein
VLIYYVLIYVEYIKIYFGFESVNLDILMNLHILGRPQLQINGFGKVISPSGYNVCMLIYVCMYIRIHIFICVSFAPELIIYFHIAYSIVYRD